jgi:Delta7-sterol 5-desaturase
MFVNIWTVSIHDADYRVLDIFQPIINGSAHHTDHHLYYNYNYGQFFTLWDRIGGSFRKPSAFDNQDPKSQIYAQKKLH